MCSVSASVLVDSGSDITVISESFRRRARCVATAWRGGRFCGADSHVVTALNCRCTFRLVMQKHTFLVSAVVFKNCVADIILGCDFLREHGASLDFLQSELTLHLSELPLSSAIDVAENRPIRLALQHRLRIPPYSACVADFSFDGHLENNVSVLLEPDAAHHLDYIFPRSIAFVCDDHVRIPLLNTTHDEIVLFPGMRLYTCQPLLPSEIVAALSEDSSRVPVVDPTNSANLAALVDKSLNVDQHQKLLSLLLEFSSSFDSSASLGQASNVTHTINVGETLPIRQRLRRHSSEERRVIASEVETMLARGVIELSSSPWASPVVLVRKKDNS